MAATDPGRAARVLADAEAIARSLTDEDSNVVATGAIAEALAATDPGRAEAIARSLTDGFNKAWVLSCVAETLVSTSLSLKSGRSAVRPRP